MTALDIDYSVLVYESAFDVWEEEINKNDTCETCKEKRAFKSMFTLKHNVKQGSRIAPFKMVGQRRGKSIFVDSVVSMMN